MRTRRIPEMMQMSTAECGAACLAMVLAYHGRKTALAECRERCGSGRDGTTALTIANAAREYGLVVRAFSLAAGDVRNLDLPAIVHWKFNHFVVVEHWSPKHVGIVDPATGRRRLAQTEFSRDFTGVALTFEKCDQPIPAPTSDKAPWLEYVRNILGMPGIAAVLFQILGASLLLQLLGLAVPFATKVLIDQLLPLDGPDLIAVFIGGVATAVLSLGATSYLRSVLLIYLEALLDSRMMLGFLQHVLALPFSFFQQRTTGDLLMRLGSNSTIRETLVTQSVPILLDGCLVLVYLTILLTLKPVLGLLVAGLALGQMALLLGVNRRVHHLTQQDLCASSASQSYLVEALSGIATIKTSGAENRALAHWSGLFFNHLSISVERSRLTAGISTAIMTLRALAPLLLLWVGALYVLEGRMSIGAMLGFNALSMSVLMPVASLVSSAQQLQMVRAHLERISDVLEAKPEQNLRAVFPAPVLAGQIQFCGVGLCYDRNAPPALRDITFCVKPGQKVAIAGRTGSGKSSLAKLMLGLYPYTEGEILFDGVPLASLNHQSVRRQIGAVLQESFLFSGSIRQNIAFNDPSLPLDRLMEAARLAGIHDEIMTMPMGYETILCEGATSLSGGQRQRLLLARAVAHKPPILLLDEATSHLDPVTERAIDRRLADMSCTRIVIAHRLSTVRNADLIIILDQGMIVESGSHDDLLVRGGAYAALVRSDPALDSPDPSPAHPAAVSNHNGHRRNTAGSAIRTYPIPAG